MATKKVQNSIDNKVEQSEVPALSEENKTLGKRMLKLWAVEAVYFVGDMCFKDKYRAEGRASATGQQVVIFN